MTTSGFRAMRLPGGPETITLEQKMSLLGGLSGGGFNIGSLLTSTILGAATGGISTLVQTALTQLASQIGQQVLQNIGQQLGLPQPMIDLAQGAFAGAIGDTNGFSSNLTEASNGLASAVGGGVFEAGEIQRQANDAVQWLTENFTEQLRNGVDGEGGQTGAAGAAASKGADSFLMKLALAMGKAVDSKMDEMLKTAKDIDKAKSGGDESEITQMSAKMQALSQEISMLSNALNTSLKALGESASTLARKQ